MSIYMKCVKEVRDERVVYAANRCEVFPNAYKEGRPRMPRPMDMPSSHPAHHSPLPLPRTQLYAPPPCTHPPIPPPYTHHIYLSFHTCTSHSFFLPSFSFPSSSLPSTLSNGHHSSQPRRFFIHLPATTLAEPPSLF